MKFSDRQQTEGGVSSRQNLRSAGPPHQPWSVRAKLTLSFGLAWLVLTVYGSQVWWIGTGSSRYVDHLCALPVVLYAVYLILSRTVNPRDAATGVAENQIKKSPLTLRTALSSLFALSLIYMITWWAVGPAVSALTTISFGTPAVRDANLEKIRETNFIGKGAWSCNYKVDLLPAFGSGQPVEWCATETDVRSLKTGAVQLKGYESRLGFKVAQIVPAKR